MRMKRFAVLVLVLLLAALPSAALAAEDVAPEAVATDSPVILSTAEDLQKLAAVPQGSFILNRDIDMTGISWTPVAFSGTFNGNGHTIYNLTVNTVGSARADTVDGNSKVYDSVFSGFFSTLVNAQVSDLTLRGVNISVTSPEHCFVGGLTGYIKDSTLTRCNVLSARLSLTSTCQPDPANPRTSCNAGIGGLVGFGNGFIRECTTDVTMVFDDQCSRELRCEEFMGGILACGLAEIKKCTVTINGYDACRGYAHNGGLVGMYFKYDRKLTLQPISYCSVTGTITFFEDNADRRAYCEAFVGEPLTWPDIFGCSQSFVRNETFDYTQRLNPEQCADPTLTEILHEPSCEDWGFVSHTCLVCGNTWNDSFVPPAHDPGPWEILVEATYTESGERQRTCQKCEQVIDHEIIPPHVAGDWITVLEPEYGVDGLRQRLCVDCGQVLEEEILPARVGAAQINLSYISPYLHYKDSVTLTATVVPENAENKMVYFSSSDPKVATVDTDGTIHAVGRGSAVITCASADGNATANCSIRVDYSPEQWVIMILLFGWLWY